MESFVTCDISDVARDLLQLMSDCNNRRLRNTGAWAAELYYSLDHTPTSLPPTDPNKLLEDTLLIDEFCKYSMAKCCFDAQEYDRAAFFTENCYSPAPKFLHYYSTFCSSEKKELDDFVDIAVPLDKSKSSILKSLRAKLQKAHLKDKLDGFCLYLYGIVLKKLKLDTQAIEILTHAIYAEPLNWGAWYELASLITDGSMLKFMTLPKHWMKNFFLAVVYLDLQRNELALEIYSKLMDVLFPKSTYLMAQIAIAFHNMRDLEKSIGGFQELLELDPYRLDNMDIYSNLLYVREMRNELSSLAVHLSKTDKYRVETCCVIGNYFSLRVQHEQAVRYFQRALRLNPSYLSAWTLMGHEYMEMKNTSFAIYGYRRAIECHKRDYRAWYGLGQTYEILKMPFYCLYYYKRAQELRPHDSRMMVALGEAYEKLEKYREAKKCYWKAHAKGDLECLALLKLAKIYEKLNEELQAAAAYSDCIRDTKSTEREELWHAFLFLGKYYLKCGHHEKAYEYAQQCLEFPETREDAKMILKQINTRRLVSDISGPSRVLCPDLIQRCPSPMELMYPP